MINYKEELITKIETIEDKVKQLISGYKHFDTTKGIYEIIEIQNSKVKEMYTEDKIHNVFSSNGCKFSGIVTVRAFAYPPNSDKSGYTSHCFKINFKPVVVKFDFETESFNIEAPIDIDYITLEDTWMC
ncbi:P-loop NTPase family protein [Algoriphagus yeomjeoni]|uniref:Uncharacterized protein n=1 Tax=Algoriphagus yeomjeoni TaxID=291403 RepID=A0A327PRA8_9BACT|nr:hypothetical protein [Algoriphagus yeomjeoni]RAI93841.1 hypothetical protein LV83_00747 [Algoriphagus yeomjeoni]